MYIQVGSPMLFEFVTELILINIFLTKNIIIGLIVGLVLLGLCCVVVVILILRNREFSFDKVPKSKIAAEFSAWDSKQEQSALSEEDIKKD